MSVGIDGCNGKWVAVYITKSHFEVGKFNTIEDICNRYPEAHSFIIDIPIGLAESEGDIRPDRLVRKELGKKSSSIFEVPCRQAIYAKDKITAREQNIAILGKSLSEQTLGISKAIKQVDEFLQSNIQWKNKLVESHPEFCFLKLNNNIPVLENKKSKEGQHKRLEIIRRYYPDANQVVDKFLYDVSSRKKIDDVIDAMCLAVIGKMIIENGLKTIPENPMMDSKDIMMQMVYAEWLD
ncbi:DUF429 domain-containing protein [Clostridium sp.]|uniref:DUF429 domain-containing protein n=1 Tax=Clostridium sp. TaxID=1506 RepID=UPI003D6CFFD5